MEGWFARKIRLTVWDCRDSLIWLVSTSGRREVLLPPRARSIDSAPSVPGSGIPLVPALQQPKELEIMSSSASSKCSQIVMAGAIALLPAALPVASQAANLSPGVDTHLTVSASRITAGRSSVANSGRVVVNPNAVYSHHDNDFWVFHNHNHVTLPLSRSRQGGFDEGSFAV
jgi:hypothetical protein